MVTVWGELSPAKPLDATERVLIRGWTEVRFGERSGPIVLKVNSWGFDPELTLELESLGYWYFG